MKFKFCFIYISTHLNLKMLLRYDRMFMIFLCTLVFFLSKYSVIKGLFTVFNIIVIILSEQVFVVKQKAGNNILYLDI